MPYDRSFSIPNKLVASNNGTVPVRYQSMSVNQPRAAVSHSNLWSTQPMNNQYGLTNLVKILSIIVARKLKHV